MTTGLFFPCSQTKSTLLPAYEGIVVFRFICHDGATSITPGEKEHSMKDSRWQIKLALLLLCAAFFVYFLHYLIFHDFHHIAIYFVGDVAFIFIEVLLVTLVFHQVLENRDRNQKFEKLNMVIGTFFSAVGTHLLTSFSDTDPDLGSIKERLVFTGEWNREDLQRARKLLQSHSFKIDICDIDLVGLRNFLIGKEDLLIRMLENPVLLEHETFTETLRAVFHLTEELKHRKDLSVCGDPDLAHLTVDIQRAYGYLARQWLEYMMYLKANYPYLFSLAMRTNPFDEKASVYVS